MDLNIRIFSKINVLTQDQPQIGRFIIQLLDFEAEGNGWYKEHYQRLLEKFSQEGRDHENSAN